MNLNVLPGNGVGQSAINLSPDHLLKVLVYVWFAVAFIGQYYFAVYVAIRYGVPLATGHPEQMNLSMNITGHVAGDKAGNFMLYSHVVAAALLGFGGLIQLLPAIRKRLPVLHRWNGRLFLMLGFTGALSGLYLTWLRDSRFSDIGSIGVTINGFLIPLAVYFAWRYAISRQFAQHKRWAIHTFFLINGVWSFRIYLMSWYTITGGGWGNNSTLDGPADMFISFACYLLPMAIAEMVFWAQRSQKAAHKWLVNTVMTSGILITVIGVGLAIVYSWTPRIVIAIEAAM